MDALEVIACQRFGLRVESLRDLGGFESRVFAANRGALAVVLKISQQSRMSVAYLRGEIALTTALERHGLVVPTYVASRRGAWVELLPAGSTATVQTVVAGRRSQPEDDGPQLWHLLGKTLGELHNVTRTLPRDRVAGSEFARARVHEAARTRFAHLPAADKELCKLAGVRATQVAHAFAQGFVGGHTGLIHGDLHHGNFFLAGDQLAVFDFDDCVYSCFVHDLAICLFYTVSRGGRDPHDRSHVHRVLDHLHAGYSEVATLPTDWLSDLGLWIALREIEQYTMIRHALAPEEYSPWVARFMHHRRERLLSQQPYLDLPRA